MYYINQFPNTKDIGGCFMNTKNFNLNTTADGGDDNTLFDQIKECASITASDGKHVIQCLTIIGEIEGHIISSSQNNILFFIADNIITHFYYIFK